MNSEYTEVFFWFLPNQNLVIYSFHHTVFTSFDNEKCTSNRTKDSNTRKLHNYVNVHLEVKSTFLSITV